MLKDCSIESVISPGLFLNFDEEGLVNICVVEDGDLRCMMSLSQWENIWKMVEPETTLDKLLWDHFEAKFGDA